MENRMYQAHIYRPKFYFNFRPLQGVSKKVDDFETALNLAKRLEVGSFFINIHCLGTLRCRINENILKFKCFKPRGVRILKHIKTGLRAKFKGLKVILSWLSWCFIAVQNFKKL